MIVGPNLIGNTLFVYKEGGHTRDVLLVGYYYFQI